MVHFLLTLYIVSLYITYNERNIRDNEKEARTFCILSRPNACVGSVLSDTFRAPIDQFRLRKQVLRLLRLRLPTSQY